MKLPVLAFGLAAALAFAAPAEAAKKRKPSQPRPPATVQNDPTAVFDYNGRVAGSDPDPHIRAMIRKDPRPWEGTN